MIFWSVAHLDFYLKDRDQNINKCFQFLTGMLEKKKDKYKGYIL